MSYPTPSPLFLPLKVCVLMAVFMGILWGSAKAQIRFDSSHVVQITDSLFPGQNDAKMLQLEVFIGGTGTDTIWTRRIAVSTKGTGSLGLINGASLYYRGFNPSTTGALDSVNLFGSRLTTVPSNFSFSDSIPLIRGTHYFLLCYDISSKAQALDSFDAEMPQVIINGTARTPNDNAPVGDRRIAQHGGGIYCSYGRSTAGNFQIGPTHVQLGDVLSAYSDNSDIATFSTIPVPVVKNKTYKLSLRAGPYFKENMRVWIDWDSDGFFENDERVYTISGLKASQRTEFQLKIPCDVSLGYKRMRILSDLYKNSLANACDNVDQGSGEDYILHILEEQKPTASFATDTSIYEGGKAFLVNTTQAQGVDIDYNWDFGNNGIINATSQDLRVTVGTAGNYPVRLVATLNSCNGKKSFVDSFIDTLRVDAVGSRAPTAEFIASQNQVSVGEYVQLKDLSDRGVFWQWNILPALSGKDSLYNYVLGSNANSQNPSIEFLAPGSYSVVCYIANKNGSDSLVKINYINVEAPISLCNQSSIQQDTLTAEHGTIVDNGGIDSVYAHFLNCNLLIKPICADEVHLDLNEIDITRFKLPGAPGDFLKVYDGKDATGTPLHSGIGYSSGIFSRGNDPVNLGRLTARSGKMFITFETDTSTAADGFVLKYSISKRTIAKPTASIIANDSVFINHETRLSSNDARNWVKHYWDFNNDGVPDEEGKDVTYKWTTTGKFRVTLLVDACGASDTVHKIIEVVHPKTTPKADFTTTFTRVSTRDTVRLIDASSNGPSNYRWDISGGAVVRYLNGTSKNSKNPVILLDSLGTYTIKLWVSNSLGADSLSRTNYLLVRNYCEPYVISALSERGISRVVLKDFNGNTLIDKASEDQSGYSNFSKTDRLTLERGAQYFITVVRKDTTFSIQRALWLDLDSDGRFDAAEKLLSEGPSKNKTWTDSFKVPMTAAQGLGRMRFATNAAGQTDYGCGPHVTGEFEDYGVVISKDLTAPHIHLIGGDTVLLNQCATFVEPGFTSKDNVDGDLSTQTSVSGSVNERTPGTYELTYSAADKEGNLGSAVRIVQVSADTIAPIIQLLGANPIFVEVFDNYTDAGYTLTDNCQAIDTFTVKSSVNTKRIGLYQVVITATDDKGNIATQSRDVIVRDTEAPVFEFLNNSDTVYVEGNGLYQETDWRVTDNYDATPNVVISGFVNTSVLDTYRISYTVTDTANNGPTIALRIVIVQDKTPPEIQLTTKLFEIEVGRKVSLPEPVYGDSFDPNPELFRIGSYDKDVLGLSNIRYYALDASGNSSDTVVLQVMVYDDEAPLIQLLEGPFITTCRWTDFNDPGIVLSDNHDGVDELTVRTELLNGLNAPITEAEMVQKEGFYTLKYEVEDISGNKTSLSRTVQVVICNVGLNQPNPSPLSLYPVPASDVLMVRGNKDLHFHQIRVRNILGEEVLYLDVDHQSLLSIDVASLPSGFYLLELVTNQGTQTPSFTVHR